MVLVLKLAFWVVSGPSRGKVDAMHKGLDVSIYAKPELFPPPLEVDK